MKLWQIILLIAGAFILVALFNSFYTVRQDKQALVLQFGDPQIARNAPGSDEAGLYFKAPFVQNVVILSRKNLGTDIADIEVLASDQRRLTVDAFVRWRISDPLKFYQRLRTQRGAESQLERFTESAIRDALGQVPVPEIISGQRSELMNRIREDVNRNLTDAGIDIIDVRIRQADLPAAVAEGVYNRMRTARQQESQSIRSQGEEASRLIRARAEREKTVIEAQAREQSEVIRGEGDAKRNDIYATAYQADPEFFRFQRALIACEKAIQSGTQVVVSPENLDLCNVFAEQAEAAGRGGGR